MSTVEPNMVIHFQEADSVSFEVIDSMDGDSVRGRYAGPYPGAVRPDLRYQTDSAPAWDNK